ncbi:MAG: AAA family ATPase [Bdellovibrionota bacterium]
MKLRGYQLLGKISDTRKVVVYRGFKLTDPNHSLVFKALKPLGDALTNAAVTELLHEYEVIKQLQSENIIHAFDVIHTNESVVLILEDFGGISLKEFMAGKPLPLATFLKIAIQVARALSEIHAKNIIHKDIKPHNILIDKSGKIVKITDFGIASQITRENEAIYSNEVLQGTLPYISPEQSGRMNRSIDYRTDLYSLGVTFYEMLTGRVPFESKDPMELIHCHLAKYPPPPSSVNSTVPQVLSDIVLKLLSKTAEDRYQSSKGLLFDLETCLSSLEENRTIRPFKIGEKDYTGKFSIPKKLYGRERDSEALLAAFDRACKGSVELMLVSGSPGIGKSALIQEIHRPITRQKGYFVSGKYDQFRKDMPYSALIQALQGLIKQLLTESPERVEHWKREIENALGPHARVMIDLIPELKAIIGEHSEAPALDPIQAQVRFLNCFLSLIQVFTSKEHPLAIFLDDLQWADLASLDLIKSLLNRPNCQSFYLICSYRDSEVTAAHPFSHAIEELKKTGTPIARITLTGLDFESVSRLLSETLNLDGTRVEALARVILKRTGGNPFYIRQFLDELRRESFFKFDEKTSTWSWQLEDIHQLPATENVVELMTQKIRKLHPDTQEVLHLASCIGNSFDLETLSLLYEKTPKETFAALSAAIEQDYVLNSKGLMRFVHDKIQEAAYGLTSPEKRKQTHLKIGQSLLHRTKANQESESFFDVVDHLNIAQELITRETDKVELARLNLYAGKRAKSSTAYPAAAEFFRLGIDALPGDYWKNHYEVAIELFLQKAECEYLCGRMEETERVFHKIISQAKRRDDLAQARLILLIQKMHQGRYAEAVQLGLDALKLYGVDLPLKPSRIRIKFEQWRAKRLLGKRRVLDLASMPDMTEPDKRLVVKIMNFFSSSAYLANYKNLYALIGIKMSAMSFKFGNNYDVVNRGYGLLAASLIQISGDFKMGHEFGLLAIALGEKYNNVVAKGGANFMFGAFINFWNKPLDFRILRKGYQCTYEAGDLNRAGYSLAHLIAQMSFLGNNLEEVTTLHDKHIDFIRQQSGWGPAAFMGAYHWASCLMGRKKDPEAFNDQIFDEDRFYESLPDESSKGFFRVFQIKHRFVFGQYDSAYRMSFENAIETVNSMYATMFIPEYCFIAALAITKVQKNLPLIKRLKNLRLLNYYLSKLRLWSENCPENFAHKLLLVEAEVARMRDKPEQAQRLYEAAIDSAFENNYLINAAIGCELACNYYLTLGMRTVAQSYITKAFSIYSRLGATAKAKHLETTYQGLLSLVVPQAQRRLDPNSTSSLGTETTLDLNTVIKSTQSISEQIHASKILDDLMRLSIENAGAQKGFFIIEKDGKLVIEASRTIDGEVRHENKLLNDSDELSHSVVHFVFRSAQSLVLDNASQDERFMEDPYVVNVKPKSILCIPVIKQATTMGLLYLENNLGEGSFTNQRIEILKILASQSAISLENARLYEELQEYNQTLEARVKSRTKEISDLLNSIDQGIFTVNDDLSVNQEHSSRATSLFGISEFKGAQLKDILKFTETQQKAFKEWLEVASRPQNLKRWRKYKQLAPVQEIDKPSENGKRSILEIDYQPVTEDDRFQKLMVLGKDITEKRLAEEALILLKKEQEAQMGRLTGIIGHDSALVLELLDQTASVIETLSKISLKSEIEANTEALFRQVHTLKGNTGSYGFQVLAQISGRLEDILQSFRDHDPSAPLLMADWKKTVEDLKEEYKKTCDVRDRISSDTKKQIRVDRASYEALLSKLKRGQVTLNEVERDLIALESIAFGAFSKKFSNIVRIYRESSGKEILDLVIHNPEMLLHRNLALAYDDICLHLIRNAIDHGIEPIEERRGKGKGAGKIEIKLEFLDPKKECCLTIADDGRGIDPDQIARSAVDKGLVSSSETDSLSDQEKISLIFKPGFSTKSHVSEISGRGVGLDVVQSQALQYNGRVEINTKMGLGTTFKVYLPIDLMQNGLRPGKTESKANAA